MMAPPSKLALNPGVPPRLPSVDRLLAHPDAATLVECFGRTATVDALRTALAAARTALQETSRLTPPSEDILIARAEGALTVLRKPSLKVVFNLTGTVLHTNLGRALLNEEAAQAVARVLTWATNLEFDLETGKRGERDSHVEALICRLTGAEAATIVNNNAAAVLLVLTALTSKKEVLVSRGELVEIGGPSGFRT